MKVEVTLVDYLIGILFFIFIYAIAFVYNKYKSETDNDYKYFSHALMAKMFGGIGFLLLTVHYWKGGDTFNYYSIAEGYTSYFASDFLGAVKLLFSAGDQVNWHNHDFAYGQHIFLETTASFTIVKITLNSDF